MIASDLHFAGIPNHPSYPTGSLDFLTKLQDSKDSEFEARNATQASKTRLNVLVVGAGLGGLAVAISLRRMGHAVTVLEQATSLGEVGAGIQIPSNSARILMKWGLGPYLGENVVEPQDIKFRRWENGQLIGLTTLRPDFQERFGAPYYVVHRAHFHDAMYKLALDLGARIKTKSQVVDYDLDRPSLRLTNGTEMTADLIVAADGVKSVARSKILIDDDVSPSLTGFAAYRATVDVEKMKADPDTAWLLEKPGLNIWIGDMRHVMTYTIAAGKSFNMVLSHPDRSDPKSWHLSLEDCLQDMKKQFCNWDRCLTKVIGMISSTLKWPLMSGQKLKKWLSPSGRVMIMGDAAHAMLPYMSQGAAMAIEDAAALGEVLGHVINVGDLGRNLRIWEKVRMMRSGQMQDASLINGKLWHFADGEEQQARDRGMRAEVVGETVLKSPNQWTDPKTQQWAYGYDAEEEIRLELAKN